MPCLRYILDIFFGPNLYNVYEPTSRALGKYEPNSFEVWPNTLFSTLRCACRMGVWCSPVLLWWLHGRGLLLEPAALSHHLTHVWPLPTLTAVCALLLTAAVFIRAAGRYSSAHYRQFAQDLRAAHIAGGRRSAGILSRYDFDTRYAPVDFVAKAVASQVSVLNDAATSDRLGAGLWNNTVVSVGSYALAHTVGLALMYPGSVGIMQTLLGAHLVAGRARLVEKLGGRRSLLLSTDGAIIDTMFVDRRNRSDFPHGNRLAVTCEGNAGFYEVGSMQVALEAGYSVLGWNHPGFAGSTGAPFPDSERAAVSAVMQFARERLGFEAHDTIIYSWSIGGFTAGWAAANNPHLSALVLDATFDDVVPLALTRMPAATATMVEMACRRYMNLHLTPLVARYHGPLLLVRRTRDEIITTTEMEIGTNRANNLLVDVLRARYPALLNNNTEPAVWVWLSAADAAAQAEVRSQHNVDDAMCEALMKSHAEAHDRHMTAVPSNIGEDMNDRQRCQLLLYLASRYMVDYEGTHCAPLPAHYLHPSAVWGT